MEVANAAADAVGARHGTHWKRGNGCEIICTYMTVSGQSRIENLAEVYFPVDPSPDSYPFLSHPFHLPLEVGFFNTARGPGQET